MKFLRALRNRARGARRPWTRGNFGAAVGLIMGFTVIAARATEPATGPAPLLTADETRQEFEIYRLKHENDFKNALELEKLSAEIMKLNFENGWGQWLVPVGIPPGIAILGFVASILGTLQAIKSEREKTPEQIRAALAQATHEKKLDCYAELMNAMSPLALYFPECELERYRCLQIGSAMSQWYFTVGGLLLSSEARDEYSQGTSAAFQDYLLLQTLSSRLRSALAEDIASRGRPRPEEAVA